MNTPHDPNSEPLPSKNPPEAPPNGGSNGAASNGDGHLRYLITAYLFDSLTVEGREEVEEHLEACAECRAEFEELSATRDLLEDALDFREGDDASEEGGGSSAYSFEAHRLERVIAAGRERKQRARILQLSASSVLKAAASFVILCGVFGAFVLSTAGRADKARPALQMGIDLQGGTSDVHSVIASDSESTFESTTADVSPPPPRKPQAHKPRSSATGKEPDPAHFARYKESTGSEIVLPVAPEANPEPLLRSMPRQREDRKRNIQRRPEILPDPVEGEQLRTKPSEIRSGSSLEEAKNSDNFIGSVRPDGAESGSVAASIDLLSETFADNSTEGSGAPAARDLGLAAPPSTDAGRLSAILDGFEGAAGGERLSSEPTSAGSRMNKLPNGRTGTTTITETRAGVELSEHAIAPEPVATYGYTTPKNEEGSIEQHLTAVDSLEIFDRDAPTDRIQLGDDDLLPDNSGRPLSRRELENDLDRGPQLTTRDRSRAPVNRRRSSRGRSGSERVPPQRGAGSLTADTRGEFAGGRVGESQSLLGGEESARRTRTATGRSSKMSLDAKEKSVEKLDRLLEDELTLGATADRLREVRKVRADGDSQIAQLREQDSLESTLDRVRAEARKEVSRLQDEITELEEEWSGKVDQQDREQQLTEALLARSNKRIHVLQREIDQEQGGRLFVPPSVQPAQDTALFDGLSDKNVFAGRAPAGEPPADAANSADLFGLPPVTQPKPQTGTADEPRASAATPLQGNTVDTGRWGRMIAGQKGDEDTIIAFDPAAEAEKKSKRRQPRRQLAAAGSDALDQIDEDADLGEERLGWFAGHPADRERALRAYHYYRALDAKLDFGQFQAQPLPIPSPVVGDEGLGREGFREAYGVNPFVETERDAQSTFAMDVDTASFTRTQATLASGQRVDPSTVRTEEFVNAFPDNRPADMSQAFTVWCEGGPSPFGGNARSGVPVEQLQITVKARDLAPAERRPVILTFAIDTSGSMEFGSRLEAVRSALETLLENLGSDDRVGIIAYGTQPYLVLPHTAAREKKRILDAIEGLTALGSTNVEAGLDLAYRIADESTHARAESRVVLCSDGVATSGARSAEEILEKVRVYADRGIYLTVVGFGQERYDDAFLEQLANRGNGNYAYVDSARDAARLFRDNLPAALSVLARDAKIQVEFDPDVVSQYRLLGYENRDIADKDFRNDKIDAGEVGPGSTVTAIYEVVRRPTSSGALGRVFLRYHDTTIGRVEELDFPIPPGIVATRIDDTSPRFRLLSSVAELAELLRGSYFARNGTFTDVLDQLTRLSPPALAKPEVRALIDMTVQARDASLEVWSP